jgi:hypothetical protein
MTRRPRTRLALALPLCGWLIAPSSTAQTPAIPTPVTAADYTDLLERPPFRRVLSLSDSLVLSGVAALGEKKLVTVWNRATGESFVATGTPNPQGWRLVELVESSDLRHVTATIEAGTQKVTLRFDPERLAPPKLDNTSKPGKRSEQAIVVEAMLRSLDPTAARQFETLPPAPQESFRKSFAEVLSTYPTAPDSRRLAFVRQALEEAVDSLPDGETAPSPGSPTPPPASPAATTPATPPDR